MLIRQKITTMNDEYHHADIVGMYPILTDASANVLRSYVFDAYAVPQSQQQFVGESYPVQSTHTGTCSTAMSEPGMSSSPSGGAVSCQARALNVENQHILAMGCFPTLACLTLCRKIMGPGSWTWCSLTCLTWRIFGCTWLFNYCISLGDEPLGVGCMNFYLTWCPPVP